MWPSLGYSGGDGKGLSFTAERGFSVWNKGAAWERTALWCAYVHFLGRALHRAHWREAGPAVVPSPQLWEWRLVNGKPLPTACKCSKPLLTVCAFSRRYLQADIEAFDIRELTPKFDVILLEPPLEEYYRETGITANEKCWTWDDVRWNAACGEQFVPDA